MMQIVLQLLNKNKINPMVMPFIYQLVNIWVLQLWLMVKFTVGKMVAVERWNTLH